MAEAEDILNSGGIPSFPYPDSAARVFEYMWQYSRNLHSLYETPVLDEEGLGAISPSSAATIQAASWKRENGAVRGPNPSVS